MNTAVKSSPSICKMLKSSNDIMITSRADGALSPSTETKFLEGLSVVKDACMEHRNEP